MRLLSPSRPRRLVALLVLAALTVAAAPASSAPPEASADVRADLRKAAQTAADRAPAALGRERTAVPQDRYAMAGGCYAVRSVATDRYLTRSDGTLTATSKTATASEPLHFQATDLGRYLLYATARDFLSASEGTAGEAAKSATDTAPGAAVDGLTVGTTGTVAEAASNGPAGRATGRGDSVVLAAGASELADWSVEEVRPTTYRFSLPALGVTLVAAEDGRLALTSAGAAERQDEFTLQLTDGCAKWPEVNVNVSGPVARGGSPLDEVRGYVDAHLHAMAFEFIGGRIRCGRPWHPYGVTHALRGCKEHELAGGRLAVAETVLSGRDPVAGHNTNAGWPTFSDWPKPSSLTYEQVYYKWLERAWRGGLRMFTNLLVDNTALCKVYPYKRNSCNEMDGVRLQHQRIQELERYIDAQYGGPGRGWFRIVTDPFQARRVMNEGKLAVVLGIEVSVLFDCAQKREVALCTADEIDARLDEVYKMGVRQMELVNKFDNALSGVTGDNATFGAIVNNANFMETGSYWRMQTCAEDAGHSHDKRQYNLHDESGAPDQISGRDSLVGLVLQQFGGTGAAPVYGEGPHCNALGLTPLGEHLVRRMIGKGMIFDPDHMSAKARDQAMDILEAHDADGDRRPDGYSGVISSHSWADEGIYERIWKLGGVVTPHAGSSASFVEKWREQKKWQDPRFYFGLGFGSDMNGFSNQGPAPRRTSNTISYPFTGLGGVTVDKQVSGEKVYDFNVDGVAHYGMYPDWVEDVRLLGGDEIVADLQRAPEAFLQMWERAVGVTGSSCRADRRALKPSVLDQVRRGMTPEQVLLLLGQPAQRDADSLTYCVAHGTATVRFGPAGLVRGVDVDDASSAVQPAGAAGSGKRPAGAAPAAAPAAAAPTVATHDHSSHEHTVLTAAADQPAAWLRLLVLGGLVVLLLAGQVRPRRARRRRL
jgi:hypothetical protein